MDIIWLDPALDDLYRVTALVAFGVVKVAVTIKKVDDSTVFPENSQACTDLLGTFWESREK